MIAACATGTYRTAVAELPLSLRLEDRAAGAIVVVPGRTGWVDAVRQSAADGAYAIVVADPVFTPAAEVRRLASEVGVPVIIERPLLRSDDAGLSVAGRAGAEPRMLIADATAPRTLVRIVAREAIGWLRMLGGGPLRLESADGTFALLRTPGGIAAMVTVVASRSPGNGRIRAQALGEVTSAVEVEGRSARITTTSVAGALTAPNRFESSERLALRRALGALTASAPPHDLDDLADDTELVQQMQDAP